MNLIKVKDKSGLYRDEKNNAIVNMNQSEYQNYIESYKKAYNERERIKNLENDIDIIRNDLNEIKNLLKNLSNGS